MHIRAKNNRDRNKVKIKIKGIRAAVIVFIFVIGALFLYAAVLQKELNNDIKTTLAEISEQSVKTIRNEVKAEFNLIREISRRLTGSGKFQVERDLELLKEISENYPFRRMGIIVEGGTAYTTDEVQMNLKDREFYESALQEETVLSDRLIDRVEGDGITVYATPVYEYESNEIAAVLFATYSIESFQSLVSVDTFEGEGYSYIVKQNGEIVADSAYNADNDDLTNILDIVCRADKKNEGCSSELRAAMAEGASGYIVVHNQEEKYMYYTPLGVNDWYLMNVVPSSAAEKSVTVVMGMTYALCLLVAGLTVLFMLYLAKSEKKRQESVNRVLYVDPLTGGASYTKFTIDAKLSLVETKKNAAFIVLDLDNFKLVNEVYGQEMGDRMLRYIHDTLRQCAREDTLYARRMADRFVILMYYDTEEELTGRIESFFDQLRKYQPELKNNYTLKPSLGIYLVQDHNEDLQRMQTLASIARASIKHKNNGYIAYYNDIYRDTLIYNKQLEDQMESAYQNGEFIPYFQPKYDAKTKKIVGAEALVRWQKPDGKIISPGTFIPLAESNGFIVKLDRLMFDMVCKRQQMLAESGCKIVPISVNLSRQVMYDKTFIDIYEGIMKRYQMSADMVELEITESALFENQEELKNIIDELHRRGFKILMDDFGVGYSSLMMLKLIPIDILKLDKNFVDDYNDVRGREIIISVINLAKALHISITAEGIETKEQYEFFRELNCDVIQGYYFAKPMPYQEYKVKLMDNLEK